MDQKNVGMDGQKKPESEQEKQQKSLNVDAEDASALIPAYGIGATDPEDEALVRQLLEESAAAADELSNYISLTHLLMHGVPQLKPPESIATNIQSAIRQREEDAVVAPSLQRSSTLPKQTATAPTKSEDTLPTLSWLQQLSARWSWSYSVVAAVLLLLVGINLFLLSQLRSYQQVQNELTTEVALQGAAMVMLQSDEVQELIIPATDDSEETFVSLFWHPEWDVAVVYAESFPPLAPDMTYQLWLAADGKRVSGGTFTVNEVGNGTLITRAERPIDTYQVIGITTEPMGGSPGPTSPPVVRLKS